MKKSDRWAYEYLLHRSFRNVIYEPDGPNAPPDFLIDGRIAVEARRLNQNKETANGLQGLEELWKPIQTTVTTVIESMSGPPIDGSSWFVRYTFKRPVPPKKELKKLVAIGLQTFRDKPTHQPGKVRVSDNFSLTFSRASIVHPTFFIFASSSDRDSGGYVMGELVRNLKLCIAEKTRKASKVRSKYREWWLVFEDRISYGDWDESERVRLREFVQPDGAWDKTILVNPNNHAIWFEL